MKRLAGQSGQSLVEIVAMIPIVLISGLLGLQALAAGAAHVYADNAAHSGALAAQLGGNPKLSAQDALPGWATGRVQVKVSADRVKVTLEPRAFVPQLSKLLATNSSAAFVSAEDVLDVQ